MTLTIRPGLAILFVVLATLALFLALSGPPAQAQDGSVPDQDEEPDVSYVTVVVDRTPEPSVAQFTVTWNDAHEGKCSTQYNAYLTDYFVDTEEVHLGSATSDDVQIVKSVDSSGMDGGLGYRVVLLCGDTDNYRFVSGIGLPSLLPSGTYSSEPALIGLVVDSGSLEPAFHQYKFSYVVDDVPASDGRITVTATAKDEYYGIVFVEGHVHYVYPGCGGDYCIYHYSTESREKLDTLEDADADTPGFQLDLEEGQTDFSIHIHPLVDKGNAYQFSVTSSTPAPTPEPTPTPTPEPTPTPTPEPTPTPLTAGFEDAPESHNGTDNFTFRIAFSEPISISDKTFRDHSLEATSGSVTKAGRVNGNSDLWEITVEPNSDADVSVVLPVTEDCATQGAVCTSDGKMLSNQVDLTVTGPEGSHENSPASGAPTINGTAQVGETLTADTSGIADDDGLENVSFSYQWLSSRYTEIQGATDRTYTLAATDEGKAIKVRVTFTDDEGNAETLTSGATDTVASRPNSSPASGAPTINGTAQVGETLTADTSGIADDDGLENVSFSYQWLSSRDTEIGGATSFTYTLLASDEGKAIKVRVSFTDDADNQEMLTSAPTAAVAAPAQADSEDEPSELSYLTVVVTEDDSDPDNVFTTFTITWNDAEDCSASYNAYLDGVVGDPIHLGSAASEGEQIAASLTNVSAESIGFDAKLYCGTIGSGRLVDSLWIPEYSRSFDTVPISRAYLPKPGTYSTEPGLTVLTVSSGTLTPAFHSQTLNYTVPDVANADGRITLTTTTKAEYYTVAFMPGSLYFYISLCSHGGQQTSLSYQDDTGDPLYPLTDADADTPGFQMELDEGENVFKIRVWPNCENGHIYKLTVTRAANAPANTPATGAPTIGGTAQVGETLTAATSGIADADGLTGATFSYQWLSSRDTEIQGATGAAYILVPGDAGKTIKVKVSFTDDEGNAETLTSAATGAVSPRPNSPATGAPAIIGTARVGETLTADTSGIEDADGLTNVSFSYQWLSSRDTEIQGATGAAYILVPGDVGKTIKVKVSFTDDEGNAEMLTSAATGAVSPRPNSPATGTPAIIGTARVGETLTAATSGIEDADGLTGATFSYQWLSSRDTEIQGATNATYTLVTADEGKAIKVRVSFTDDAGNEEALTSEPTDAVSAAPPPPPDNVRAVTQKSSAVKLTWDAPDDATVTGYRIDRRSAANPSDQQRSAGGPRDNHTLVEDTGSAVTSYTDQSAEKGVEYEYRVSARNEAGPGEGSGRRADHQRHDPGG